MFQGDIDLIGRCSTYQPVGDFVDSLFLVVVSEVEGYGVSYLRNDTRPIRPLFDIEPILVSELNYHSL